MRSFKVCKRTIAFLTHGDRNVGGGEIAWYNLITKMDQNVFNIMVFYSKHNQLINKIEKLNIPLIRVSIDKNISTIYRDEIEYDIFKLSTNLYYIIAAIWDIYIKIKLHHIEILHVHDNLSKIIGALLSRICNVKVITNCHDQLDKSLIDRLLLWIQKHCMVKVFCVSKYVAQSFRNKGKLPDNISIIYNGIEIEQWCNKMHLTNTHLKNNNKVINLCNVALFDSIKGHYYLVLALRLILNKGVKNFKCIFCGDGREKVKIEKLITKNNLQQYIKVKGYVNNVQQVLNKVDILIVPSIKESFGIAAAEAMAMEIPVIASSVGGLSEVVKDGVTGIIVPPKDSKLLAQAILCLMDNDKLRRKMGQNGKKRVISLFDIRKNYKLTQRQILSIGQ